LGKYPTVFEGIDLLTLNWTDDERHPPCNYRIFEKLNNDKANSYNFGNLIDTAKERGFQAEYVLFDG
jgi:putative transposase